MPLHCTISTLLVASTAFLVLFTTAHCHPTQAKSASVYSSTDGREAAGSSELLQGSRSLIASHITPIAPELEQGSTAAKVGSVSRVSQSGDDGTATETGDNHQKRHVSGDSHDHRLISNQNVHENRQSQVITFHPSQNHNQNDPATIISLRPTPLTSHSSGFSHNNNPNANGPSHGFNTNSNLGANQNRHVTATSQNVNNNHRFSNVVHQSSINRGVLQSNINNGGIQFSSGSQPTSINNNPGSQTSINKGVLQSSGVINFAAPQRSVKKGDLPTRSNVNDAEKHNHRVNVIQSGSVVQHHNNPRNNHEKVPDNNRANLAQRLSSVLAANKDDINQNNGNEIQHIVSERDEARGRQISSHSAAASVKSPNSVAASQALSSGPCVAAFSVRKGLAAPTDKSKPRRLTFLDVLSNTGGWSKTNNEFEVPCAGLYFFSFNAISTKNSDFTLGLMKDGRYQVTAYGGKEGYLWGGNSVLLFLTPGEKVYLELQQGEVYEHPHDEAYTTFSGFLINSL